MTPTKLRVVIVDDESLARDAVRRALLRHPNVEIVGEAADGLAALEVVTAVRPDLVFLDIAMPGLDGLAVAEAIDVEAPPFLVFVTAYDQHAIRAFDVEALDYVLKPVTDEAIDRALSRAQSRPARDLAASIERLRQAVGTLPRHGAESVLAGATGGRLVVVPIAEIRRVDAADNYVRLHADRGEFLMRGTLKAFLARVDPARFVQVHRSFIVAVDRVREIRPLPSGDYEIALSSGEVVSMSRTFRDAVLGRWQT